jgi:hypothetical protein
MNPHALRRHLQRLQLLAQVRQVIEAVKGLKEQHQRVWEMEKEKRK